MGAGWFNDHVRICAEGAEKLASLPGPMEQMMRTKHHLKRDSYRDTIRMTCSGGIYGSDTGRTRPQLPQPLMTG